MLKLHKTSVIAGAGIAVGGIVVSLLIASAAFAFKWPWQSNDKPEKTVVVKGSVVCAIPGSFAGVSASPISLSITVNNKTETIFYPDELRSESGQLFRKAHNGHYRQEVTIPRNADKTSLSFRLECRGTEGSVIPKEGRFDVSREDLDRTICPHGGIGSPCTGPEWSQRGGCLAALLLPTPAAVAVIAASYLKHEPSTGEMYNDLKRLQRPLSGALACFDVSENNAVPVPSAAAPPQPIPPVPAITIPTATTVVVPAPKPTTSTTTQLPPPPNPSVMLAQGPAAPSGYRYAITLSHFLPSSSVSITCYDTVSPGGFYTFSLGTDGTGNAFTQSYCYSADGPDHWVRAGGVESNHVPWTVAPPPPTARATLAKGPAAPYGYRYAITLDYFPANANITITCHDSVDPGGFYTFTLHTDASGRAFTQSYCYSGDHPDHWFKANGVESNHVIW